MNWFNEPIIDAINKSKKDHLIFMVYVHDGEASSNEMNELWNNEQVTKLCSEKFVCLKLEANSEGCKQFAQIYKILCYPTTYFIGDNGIPIEIIAGSVSLDDLLGKLNKADQMYGEKNVEKLEEKKEDTAVAPSTSQDSQSIDDKVALAREKIRAIQEKKLNEEKERERNEEIERRKLGQEMLKAKQLKEEQEMKRVAEQRKKEKMEDELAKKRVLEQIQKDREEKQKKFSKEKEEQQKIVDEKKRLDEEEERKRVQAEAARKANFARLQFRLVDGSTVTEQFDADRLLGEVRDYLTIKLRELNYAHSESFSLHSTFPKRVFKDEQMLMSLRDLELAPTASLLVMPVTNKRSNTQKGLPIATRSPVTYLYDIFSLLLLPVNLIWNLLSSFFVRPASSSSPRAATSTTQTQQSNTGIRQSNEDQTRNQREYVAQRRQEQEELRRRTELKRDGNVTQIRDLNNEDDDDTNTWNGNSTQQM